MEKIAVILMVVSLLIAIGRMVRSNTSEKLFARQWAIIDTAFSRKQEGKDFDAIDFSELCRELRQKHGIHTITVIRYFALHMSFIKEKVRIAYALKDSETNFTELFDYFVQTTTQIRAMAPEAPDDFMSFDARTNVLFFSYDIWLHKEDETGKSNTRGILLISLHQLYFIPRGIEQSDFKKLFPIASALVGAADEAGELSTGIKIYSTSNELYQSTKEGSSSEPFSDTFKKELSKRFQKEGGFSFAISEIQSIYIHKILGVPHLYVSTKEVSYRLDSHKSAFESPKDHTAHLKIQLEMALNLHDKTLLPDHPKKPKRWTVVPTTHKTFAAELTSSV